MDRLLALGAQNGQSARVRPEDWTARWASGEPGNAVFVKYPAESLPSANLAPEDTLLLTEYGLPESAAPFLTFDTRPGLLGAVRSAGEAPRGTETLLEIGAIGSGDPICLDPSTGAVFYLNHDRAFAQVPMNSSVGALVQFLDLFRGLVRASVAENGPDAYLDGRLSGSAVVATVAAMSAIDPAALAVGTMWHQEFQLP